MNAGGSAPSARLVALIDTAAASPDAADLVAIERAAAEAFGRLARTDMRSGVANIIRRLARLAIDGHQPIPPCAWPTLRDGARLLDRQGVSPADVRELDERLRAQGLDVDVRPPARPNPREA